jgi:hypothetical protein
MFLLSRKIKAMGVKMVLSGEGSDEIFGGYLYFHNAPSAAALHEETVRRVKNLHLADCLRANKSTSAWGLEARVPFLDKQFLDLAMNIDPKEKMFVPGERIEKYILRKAFDTEGEPGAKPYLPKNILWRQKGEFPLFSISIRPAPTPKFNPDLPTNHDNHPQSNSPTASATAGSTPYATKPRKWSRTSKWPTSPKTNPTGRRTPRRLKRLIGSAPCSMNISPLSARIPSRFGRPCGRILLIRREGRSRRMMLRIRRSRARFGGLVVVVRTEGERDFLGCRQE